jgi:hypothetical protein
MGFSDGKRMINNSLNDSKEDVAIKGEKDEESGATKTAIVGAEVVTRATENGVNRENVNTTERGPETAVRSDTTRNVGYRGGVCSPIPPLNNFQIHMPSTCNNNSNVTTSSVSEVMQFLLIRVKTHAQQ